MATSENQETELERKLRTQLDAEETAPEAPAPEAAAATTDADPDSASADPIDPIQALTAETEDLKDQLLRARAEFDNYRKRTAREVERIRKTAAESVIHDILPVLDNLELALVHAPYAGSPLSEGVKMVLQQLLEILERSGLETIEAVGKPFDPNIHEAVSQTPSDDIPTDTVAQEYQRGYRLGGQILRPSKVVVSTGKEDQTQPDPPKK